MTAAQSPIPKCTALILCDRLTKDPSTGLYTLFEIFNGLRVSQVPMNIEHIAAYFALSGGHGKTTVTFKVTDLTRGKLVLSADCTADFQDPLQGISTHAIMNGMPIQGTGVYAFELFFGNHLLASQRLTVTKV